MPLPFDGDGPSNFSSLFFHFSKSSNSPLLFSFEVPSSNLLPFPMLPSLTLLSFDLPFSKLLSSKLMHSSNLLHFFKLLHSSQLLPFVDLLPSTKLLFSKLPSPTLLSIIKPCVVMLSLKVCSHQHSFIVHELDYAISFPLVTFVISPIEHPISSSSVHVESPMSLNKPTNLNDLPNIESDPNLLHQCPPP